jgi:hypothetical protein
MANEQGQISATARLQTIQQQFEIATINLAQPYLNPLAIDNYPLLFG